MEHHEPQPHNPEIERRAHPKSETAEISLRAQHVIRDYLLKAKAEQAANSGTNDEPELEIVRLVEDKTITPEQAYAMLVQFARDPKTKLQRSDLLELVIDYER